MGEIKQNSNKPSVEKEVSREAHREASRPVSKSRKKKVAKPIFFSVLLVALIAFGTFYFIKYQQLNDKYTEITMSADERIKGIVEKVSKLYNIPSYEKEKPAWTFFKDEKSLETLKNNQFLKDAKVNDVLLAYEKSDLAILFRPDENKIIVVDSFKKVNTGTVPVAIIAPSDKQDSIEKSLKNSFGNIVVINKSVPKSSISQGAVVDVTGKEAEATTKLASILGLPVGALPAGETAPEGAKMVIVLPSDTTPTP